MPALPPSCLVWKPPGPPQSSSTNTPMKVDRLLLPRLVHLYGDTSKTKTPPSPQIRTEVGDKGPSGPPPWVACFIDEPNQPWHHASACGFELAEGSGKWAKGNSSSQHILFPCSEPSTRIRALSHSGCSHTPGESAPLVPCSPKQQLRFLRVRGFAKVLQLLEGTRGRSLSLSSGPITTWPQGTVWASAPLTGRTLGMPGQMAPRHPPPRPHVSRSSHCAPCSRTQAWALSSPQTCGQLGESPSRV